MTIDEAIDLVTTSKTKIDNITYFIRCWFSSQCLLQLYQTTIWCDKQIQFFILQ